MIDYEKQALKILHHAKEGEYDSDLAGSDYFNWKKGAFKKREVILENYAKQVVYRYEFKKLAKSLEEFINNNGCEKNGCSLTQAQAIINLSNKLENICKEHKDNAEMNEYLEDMLYVIIPSVETENNKVVNLHKLDEQDKNEVKKGIAYLNTLEQKEIVKED